MWMRLRKAAIWAGLLIFSVIAGTVGKQVGKSTFSPTQTNPQQLKEKLISGLAAGVQEINKKVPIMVDEETRLDRAAIGPGARVTYHHSFPNYRAQDLYAPRLKEDIYPNVKKNVCTNKDMAHSLNYGAVYVYSYAGNDGIEIVKFVIDKNDCAR